MWHAPFATVYNVTTADDLQELLQHSDCLVKGRVYAFAEPFLGCGILLSEGRRWQTTRKILGQFFRHSFLKNSITPLELETDVWIRKLESLNGETVNLQTELAKYTLNTFCKVVLVSEFNSTAYLDIMTDLERMLAERLGKLHMYIPLVYYWFGGGRKFMNLSRSIRKLTVDMVQRRKAKMNAESKGLLDHLLTSELNDQSVCDEIDNLIFAGYDSTSTNLSFILFQLALDTESQLKAYSEILAQDPVDYHNMKYLECVIKECMRLYPAVPKLHRTMSKSIKCGSLNFAKGTEVSINIMDIHRDPKYFPDPDKYYPERFFTDNLGAGNPYVHIPFSFGTRGCLGKKLAVLEMKIILSKIIRNFEIVPMSRREDIKFRTGIIMRSSENFDVKFVKRN